MLLVRPGLARRRSAERGARTSARLDVLFEDARDDRGDTFGDCAAALWHAPPSLLVDASACQDDPADRHRLGMDATVRQRRVRGSEVERRNGDRAETD
jgi:hypothetical protein